jgi:hypothetical protein
MNKHTTMTASQQISTSVLYAIATSHGTSSINPSPQKQHLCTDILWFLHLSCLSSLSLSITLVVPPDSSFLYSLLIVHFFILSHRVLVLRFSRRTLFLSLSIALSPLSITYNAFIVNIHTVITRFLCHFFLLVLNKNYLSLNRANCLLCALEDHHSHQLLMLRLHQGEYVMRRIITLPPIFRWYMFCKTPFKCLGKCILSFCF